MSQRIVLIHGLASTPQEFALIKHPLGRADIELTCLDIPGYTHGSREVATSAWRDWLAGATRALDRLAASDRRPFAIGGLCTGALIAAALALERPSLAHGLVMLSPSFSLDGWGLPWWYRLRHLAYSLGLSRRFAMRERDPYGVKNERMRQWMRAQIEECAVSPVGPATVSLHAVRESERLARVVRSLWSGLSIPTLVLHARDDEICSVHSAESTIALGPPELIDLVVLEDSYHMITLDNDRAQVVSAVREFVTRIAGRCDRPTHPSELENMA
jgi:carboxylesterase